MKSREYIFNPLCLYKRLSYDWLKCALLYFFSKPIALGLWDFNLFIFFLKIQYLN